MNALLFVILAAATTASKPASGPASKPTTTAPAAAAAAPAGPAAPEVKEPSWYEHGLLGWYVDGGWFMIPLFLCQVVGIGVVIERLGTYRAIKIDTEAFRNRVKDLLTEGRVEEALKLCDDTPGPIAATLAVGLRRFKLLAALGKPADQMEADVEKSIDDYGTHVIAVLEQHLPVLASIIALGPLFGFLGTVQGMVEAFANIEANVGSGNIIKITAAGIKIALLTTILGLCVGIVSQVFYNFFTAKVNEIVLDVEESATELSQNLTIMAAASAAVKTA